MSHPTLQELTQAVHGLAPTPDHLALCADCQETVDRLRGERDLLRRADARLDVPLPKRKRGTPLFAALAAAALLAIIGAIVLRRDPLPPGKAPAAEPQEKSDVEKLITQFLDGTEKESARAREQLLESASSSLPALVETRQKRPATLRPDAFSALLVELKQKIAGPAAEPIFKKLKDTRLTLDMKNAPLSDVLAYMAQVADLNFYDDPDLEAAKAVVTLKLANTTVLQAFELLTMLYSLEFDVRYGVVFVGKPERLFDLPSWRNAPNRSVIPHSGH